MKSLEKIFNQNLISIFFKYKRHKIPECIRRSCLSNIICGSFYSRFTNVLQNIEFTRLRHNITCDSSIILVILYFYVTCQYNVVVISVHQQYHII